MRIWPAVRWLASLFYCSHRHPFLERRAYAGVGVLHYVCPRCGHAAPVMGRTVEEHRAVVDAGAVRLPTARRASKPPADFKRDRKVG